MLNLDFWGNWLKLKSTLSNKKTSTRKYQNNWIATPTSNLVSPRLTNIFVKSNTAESDYCKETKTSTIPTSMQIISTLRHPGTISNSLRRRVPCLQLATISGGWFIKSAPIWLSCSLASKKEAKRNVISIGQPHLLKAYNLIVENLLFAWSLFKRSYQVFNEEFSNWIISTSQAKLSLICSIVRGQTTELLKRRITKW